MSEPPTNNNDKYGEVQQIRNRGKVMSVKLGLLKTLKLKTVWNHEEYDFTPWLAEEDHLAGLSTPSEWISSW
ncbi:MAG: hypothetical protein IPJ18_05185 [Betaproteobacteria bacterium]|nr:hypothetical protein [Betaproteobacteria bacterium]